MKKLILSLVMMTFLMSFTNKKITEEVFSPECFDLANGIANIYEETHPNAPYEASYNVFVAWYDDCEANTLFDEFRFP